MISAKEINDVKLQRRRLIFEQYQDDIMSHICEAVDKPGDIRTTILEIPGLISVWPLRMEPLPTPEQTVVIEELFEMYDYGAALVPIEPTFVPVGLKRSDNSGPLYQHYAIQIAW